jgi:hypothetical protein
MAQSQQRLKKKKNNKDGIQTVTEYLSSNAKETQKQHQPAKQTENKNNKQKITKATFHWNMKMHLTILQK